MLSDVIDPAPQHLEEKKPVLTPISPSERIHLIDALRGFALAGVLLANLTWFTGFAFLSSEVTATFPTVVTDRILSFLIIFFVDHKFITLFSYLFGLGFAVQLTRAEEKGVRIRPLYLRRMGVLFLIGLAHLVILWFGDILTAYAVLGAVLVLFVRRSDRTLVTWGLVLGGLLGLITIVAFVLFVEGGAPNFEELDAKTFIAFTVGGYPEAARANLSQYRAALGIMVVFVVPMVFGRFLLGFWAGRKGIFHDPEAHRPLLAKIRRWGWVIGVPIWLAIAILFTAITFGIIPEESPWIVLRGLTFFGGIFMAAFYASTFSLLYLRPTWKRRLDIFAPVGRMALTNYLLQTIITVLVFYGWGLGVSGRIHVGPTVYVVYWIALFTLQIHFSRWWLTRFRFGPFEWLWRSLSYMRWQPMVLGPAR